MQVSQIVCEMHPSVFGGSAPFMLVTPQVKALLIRRSHPYVIQVVDRALKRAYNTLQLPTVLKMPPSPL